MNISNYESNYDFQSNFLIYFIGDTSMELVMEFLVTDLDLGDNSQMTFNLEQNFQGYFGVRNIEESGQTVKVGCRSRK